MPRAPLDPDDLSWMAGPPRHECGPRCNHRAGIETEKVAPGTTPPPGNPDTGGLGNGPGGGDQSLLCADCSSPLSEHTSPILRDGVVVGYANPTNACRRFVPR